MLALVDDSAVHFVGYHKNVISTFYAVSNSFQVLFGQYSAGWIFRRVQNDHFGLLGYLLLDVLWIKSKIVLFFKRDRYLFRSDKIYDRFIDWKPWVHV